MPDATTSLWESTLLMGVPSKPHIKARLTVLSGLVFELEASSVSEIFALVDEIEAIEQRRTAPANPLNRLGQAEIDQNAQERLTGVGPNWRKRL